MKVDENVFFREALRESEERHRVTLQTAMDGFFRTDMQGRILEVNKTYCRMSGYNEQELLTMNVVDIEAVHTAEMIAANIRSFAELGPKRFESHHRRKDGSLFDVEISGQYQSIAGGEIVVFVRDITERKRTEEALRQSEAYLAEAQRLSHTGSWAFDLASNKYVYVSEECFRIFELDAQEGLPTREAVSRLIHPEDWDRVNGDFEKLLREKVDTSSEFRIALPSGTAKHVQMIRHPVLNSAGDVVRIGGHHDRYHGTQAAEDRLRHTAEALRRSEAYLAEAQRLSHTGSWAFDLASDKYVYASEECFRIFEFDAQEGLPTREAISRLIHPEDWDRVHGDFEKSLREKVDTSSEFRIVLPSGTVKHIQAIRHPVLNEAGDVVELVGTTIDITERKRAEEALRLASVYNRSLIEASLDPLVTIDKQGKISDVNAATEQVTGYPRSELIGTDFSDYFTEPEKARAGYQKVFNQGFVRDYELEIRNRNGKLTPVLYNASVYRDDAGNAIGVFAAARDITERKRAEAEINSLKNYLSNIIDSMPSILVGMDNTRTVTQWNRQAEAFTGIPAGEAIGKPISPIFSPTSPPGS